MASYVTPTLISLLRLTACVTVSQVIWGVIKTGHVMVGKIASHCYMHTVRKRWLFNLATVIQVPLEAHHITLPLQLSYTSHILMHVCSV